MSQSAVILPGSPLAGSAMVGDINAAWAAIISKFSGVTAPTLGPGASGALVEGQWWLDTSVSPNILRVYDGSTWCALLIIDPTSHFTQPPQSWRNVLNDNGSFEVWQRGAGASASIAVGASTTAYTADRWYVITGANQASVIAAVTGLSAQSNLAAKVQRNNAQTGVTAYTFGFPLDTDEVVRMRGNKVSLSALFKAGANWSPTAGTITMTLYVGTGAVAKRGGGFTGETNVLSVSTNVAPSASTGNSGTSTSTVPANATQGEVQFSWTPVGTAGADDSITIDDVMLETTPFPSPTFERIPFDLMLVRCQRHFYKSFLYGTAPVQNAGVSTGEIQAIIGKANNSTPLAATIPVRFPIVMRTTPSITTYNPQATNANPVRQTGASSPTSIASVATTNVTANSVTITGTSDGSGPTIGDQVAVHVTADAGI